MIDIKKIVAWDKWYIEWIEKKIWKSDIFDKLVNVYQESNKISQELDTKRARQNALAKQIPSASSEEKQEFLAEMWEIKSFLKENIDKERELKDEYKNLLSSVPNSAHESVIKWETEDDNAVIRKFSEKPEFNFTPKPHWDLWEELDLIDSKRWAKVAWARFHFLKNDLVQLQFALVQYAFSVTTKHWFSPMIPPFMVNEKTAFWTWYLDWGHKDEVYNVNPDRDNLYMIWTSEIPNTAYYQNEIIPEEQLPIKYVSYSPCFRREAWSWWKDEKWILRCHQFDKIELAVFANPKTSYEELEKIREIEEEIYQWLGLHYQLIDICSADLWTQAAKKYDIEAWMPGQDAYREITSTSNCTDYQARRLNIRMKNSEWKNEILHTLNWTAIAIWRVLIAIMEQYQTKDWEILIPEVLKKFLPFEKISKN
jgi:seryl-tRNA synthetase